MQEGEGKADVTTFSTPKPPLQNDVIMWVMPDANFEDEGWKRRKVSAAQLSGHSREDGYDEEAERGKVAGVLKALRASLQRKLEGLGWRRIACRVAARERRRHRARDSSGCQHHHAKKREGGNNAIIRNDCALEGIK